MRPTSHLRLIFLQQQRQRALQEVRSYLSSPFLARWEEIGIPLHNGRLKTPDDLRRRERILRTQVERLGRLLNHVS